MEEKGRLANRKTFKFLFNCMTTDPLEKVTSSELQANEIVLITAKKFCWVSQRSQLSPLCFTNSHSPVISSRIM